MDTWRTGWSAADLTDIQIGTNDVKKYSNLNFVGAEAVGANSIDASSMEYFTFLYQWIIETYVYLYYSMVEILEYN